MQPEESDMLFDNRYVQLVEQVADSDCTGEIWNHLGC